MERISVVRTGLAILIALMLAGCAEQRRPKPEPCYVSAKELFERASRDFHIPSASAHGAERARLQLQAAELYRQVVEHCPEEPYWAAQAARSLGNIHAAQTNIAAAVECYTRVGERYPDQEFEVLMAWKSAGDLLWDSGQSREARQFYSRITERHGNDDASPIITAVVRGSRARL